MPKDVPSTCAAHCWKALVDVVNKMAGLYVCAGMPSAMADIIWYKHVTERALEPVEVHLQEPAERGDLEPHTRLTAPSSESPMAIGYRLWAMGYRL